MTTNMEQFNEFTCTVNSKPKTTN